MPRKQSFFRHVPQHPLGLAAVLVVAALTVLALLAPLLAPYPAGDQNLPSRFSAPSRAHLLGLDELGRDILSRLLYGSRISLFLSLVVVGFSAITGLTLGAIAGMSGGWVDDLLMRIVDVFMAFPGILLAIALVSVMGPGIGNLVLALCLMGWAGYARLTRGLALSLREREFVQSARAAGAGLPRILRVHLLPNLSGPLLVQATAGVAGVILSEAGLSFLGLGLPPPNPSWGSMLRSGTEHLLDAPHLVLYPGLAIVLMVVSFSILGDALREWLDPRAPGGEGSRRD